MTQLEKIIEIDTHVSYLNKILLLEKGADSNLYKLSDEVLTYTASNLPKQMILSYLERIDILQDGTRKAINETELEAIPAYRGNGEPDDPNEYYKQDLEELEYLSVYLNYLEKLEFIFSNELFDRESFVNNI